MGWLGLHYACESPHKDRFTGLFVCECVCAVMTAQKKTHFSPVLISIKIHNMAPDWFMDFTVRCSEVEPLSKSVIRQMQNLVEIAFFFSSRLLSV